MRTLPFFSPKSYVCRGTFSCADINPLTMPPKNPAPPASSTRSPVRLLNVAEQKSQHTLGSDPVSSVGSKTFAFASGTLHDGQDEAKQYVLPLKLTTDTAPVGLTAPSIRVGA